MFCFIAAPLLVFLLVASFSLWEMVGLKRFASVIGRDIGDDAAREGMVALEREFREELMLRAEGQALILESRLQRINNSVAGLADIYADVVAGRYVDSDAGFVDNSSGMTGISNDEFSYLRVIPEIVEDTTINAFVPRLAAMRNALRHLCVADDYIVGAGIALPEGIFFSNARRPPPANFNFVQQQWYRRALTHPEQTVWMAPVRLNNEIFIVCSRAVRVDKKSVAVAMIMVSTEAVSRDFVTTTGAETFAFLLSQHGNLVAFENPATSKFNWETATSATAELDERLFAVMRSGSAGIMSVDWHSKKLFVAYQPIPVVNWSVGVALDREIIGASTRKIRNYIGRETNEFKLLTDQYIRRAATVYLLLATLLGIVVAGFAYWMTRSINAKIGALEAGAVRLGNGDFESKINLNGVDELQELAETFNHTATGMKHYIAEFEKNVTERELRNRDMSVAAAIQCSMLPDSADVVAERDEIEICATMRPAKLVGGDFYDFFFVDKHTLFFAIGDVSGKGVPAALFMARTVVLLRDEALERHTPDKIFLAVGNELAKNNDSCMFTTALCGLLDVRSGEILLANAGHPRPFIRHGTGFEQLPLPRGSAIGAMTLNPESFALSRFKLEKGTSLLLYTDGVSEAFNAANEAFGEDGIAVALDGCAAVGPYELEKKLNNALDAFVGDAPQSDDITMLILRFHG